MRGQQSTRSKPQVVQQLGNPSELLHPYASASYG